MSWLDPLLRVFSVDLGIDLGTANTLVAVRGRGVVIAEPSVVAVKKGTKQVLMDGHAVGEQAKIMLGKNPGTVDVIRPMKDGVIADLEVTEAMLRYFIRRAVGSRKLFPPRVVIAVPSGINQVEKGAVINSCRQAGARQVYLISQPMASAIGAGLPVGEPVGSMIVEIGGGTTEVAVISMAGIVASESVRIAGDEISLAIIKFLKDRHGVIIGENTAEQVKIQLGNALPPTGDARMVIKGRAQATGMPVSMEVTEAMVYEAIALPVSGVVHSVKMVLERTQPELASDLIDRGIVMAGGTSLLRGLVERVGQETGLPTRLAHEPMSSVARGCAVLLENFEDLEQILEAGVA